MIMSLQEITNLLGYGNVEALKNAIVEIADLTSQEITILKSGKYLTTERCTKVLCLFLELIEEARAEKHWREQGRVARCRREDAEEKARHEAEGLTRRAEARQHGEECRRLWLEWPDEMSHTPAPGS